MPLLSTRGAGSSKAFGFTAGAGAVDVEYLVVASGGGGSPGGGGGGGAGGMRFGTQEKIAKNTVITVTIGTGGGTSSPGNPSSIVGAGITTIDSAGGGRGAPQTNGGSPAGVGGSGGSGGGGSGAVTRDESPNAGGAGNTPPTSPSQGEPGGGGNNPGGSGSGGGAGGAGGRPGTDPGQGARGGDGLANSITGSSVVYAGGGGGNKDGNGQAPSNGGGGGANGQAGQDNTGGGGGSGGAGGSGVTILKVPTSKYSGITTGSPTITTSGANTIITFNGAGSYTV